MGGRCTEIGIMLIGFLLPLPYCDASSSWKFPETWKRVVVACGGMLIETFFASIAAFIWAFGEEGLIKALAFNTMVISSVSTIALMPAARRARLKGMGGRHGGETVLAQA